jgi:hypothetical protein
LHAMLINHLGDPYSSTLTKKRFQTALEEALRQIILSGARPVIMKQAAGMQNDIHACIFKHIKLRTHAVPGECNFILQKNAEDKWVKGLFQAMKEKYPQLLLIDPKKVQCHQGTCFSDLGGVPLYRDVGHLTDYASYQLGGIYLQRYGNPFVK